jgi:hypothetical protein
MLPQWCVLMHQRRHRIHIKGKSTPSVGLMYCSCRLWGLFLLVSVGGSLPPMEGGSVSTLAHLGVRDDYDDVARMGLYGLLCL